MKKQINIEEKFQQAFDGFKVEPQATVWENIQSQISSAPAGSTLSAAAGKTSIIAKTIIGIAVISGVSASVYFLNRDNQNDQVPKVDTEQIVPVQEEEKSTLTNETAIEFKEGSISEEQEPGIVEDQEAVEGNKTVPILPSKGSQTEVVDTETEDVVTEEIIAVSTEKAAVEGKEESTIEKSADKVNTTDKQATVIEKEKEMQEDVVSDSQPGTLSEPIAEEKVEIQNTIPNIFTPNQDGYNDVFRIETNEADQLEVFIFDKRGAKIFEWKGLYGFWDGRLPDGKMAPEDTYFYQVILKKGPNSTVEKGRVLLKK